MKLRLIQNGSGLCKQSVFMLPRRIFRGLWGRAGAGEEIIIAKAAKPVAKLVPLSRTEVGRNAVWACWQAWPSFLRISMRRFPDL